MFVKSQHMLGPFDNALTIRVFQAIVRLTKGVSGSFTLEAALIFPVLLLAIMALLSFSLMLYNRSDLYAITAAAVDRAAFTWDNSAKDPVTGSYPLGQSDGLYWRTGSDSFSDAFSFFVRNEATQMALPVQTRNPAFTLPQMKLNKAGEPLPATIIGSLNYTNHLYSRSIQAQADRKPFLPSFGRDWFVPSTQVELNSAVTDPVELTRLVDLVRTFSGRLKAMFAHRDSALPLPSSPQPTPSTIKLTSEKEAAEYLRSLLGSMSAVWMTTPSGSQRKLDSLDPDGLFHEAKFGYTSKTESVEGQIAKDLELLGNGSQVKGVVWHFFRDSRNGKVGPSKPLRKELEKRGIVVVIHS